MLVFVTEKKCVVCNVGNVLQYASCVKDEINF